MRKLLKQEQVRKLEQQMQSWSSCEDFGAHKEDERRGSVEVGEESEARALASFVIKRIKIEIQE